MAQHDTRPVVEMKTSALFTDLYELTMAQAYAAERMDQLAVFELAFRKMPGNRNYIVAAVSAMLLTFSPPSASMMKSWITYAGTIHFQRSF